MIHSKNVENDKLFEWLCSISVQFKFAFLITDPNHQILYGNKAFTQLTGYSIKDAINKNIRFLTGKDTDIEKFNQLLNGLQENQFAKEELLTYKKDGTKIWSNFLIQGLYDDNGKHLYNIATVTDITISEEENSIEKFNIQKLAYTDYLSGLTNYNYFIDRFNENMKQQKKGFLLIIQPAEYINFVDSFGKQQLALLQKKIGDRIEKTLAHLETIVSRATEGSLIVAGFCEEHLIKDNVELLLKMTKEPMFLNEIELFVSVKIGVVSISYYNGDTDDLVRLADIALSQTKKQAGNLIVYYKDEFGIELKKRMEIQNELIHAIRNKDITMYLQPKVNIVTGKVESFEALARWFSDKLGFVPPNVFIEIAESIGKIQEVDLLVVEQVLAWLRSRKERNLKLYQISVNISPSHFYLPNFIKELRSIVNAYQIEPRYLKIELTENIGLVDMPRAVVLLEELRGYGFESSVDDFGIGFSSLSYIHQLPVTELKIDRSFINQIHEKGGSTIVRTIIQLAHNMGMIAVAEGIETEEQLDVIRNLCCSIAQGFYFYRPMPIAQIEEILENE
ncbi:MULTISPECIES: EAL domain-containing protein [Lysinibacillus]|uniref:EAL domain-containing protein n=1 Tax=Lysinibacillus TaxID=400634 RepID=UPI00131A48B4|nr:MULTISPECIES: EAL domain-containing protein [Lysinibacillus]